MLKKAVLLCLLLGSNVKAEECPVVILGGGVAALTAAIQATQAGVQPLVVTGSSPGGIITQSHSVQNWPGEIEITGYDLADKLQKQAEARGVQFLSAEAIDIDTTSRPFVITTKNLLDESVQKLQARTCIIALGATPKLLNVPGEQENLFKKIFTCAPCDGLRFKDKSVAIVGGGDSALVEASYLANIAKQVTIVVRKDKFANQLQNSEVLLKDNVHVVYNASVTGFENHNDQLTIQTPTQNLTVDGVFLAIGSKPNTDLFKGKLELDNEGYIVLKENQETSVTGIFAAGDVCDKTFRQAMTAAGDATKAILQAQNQFHSTPPKPQEIASIDQLKTFLHNSKKYSVVYFYGPTCGPCRAFRSTYDKWASQYQDKAAFAKINAQEGQACFFKYQVNAVPTIIVFDENGKIVQRATGLNEINKIPSVISSSTRN